VRGTASGGGKVAKKDKDRKASSMYILVLNQGLKSTRCIAFNYNGEMVAHSSRPIHTLLDNAYVEQETRLWESLAWEVIQDVVGTLGKDHRNIKHLTVTTSASCLVPVDASGAALRNSILVSDTRAETEARNLSNTVEFQPVLAATGTKSSPDLMIPKIMWLSRHEPECVRNTRFFLNAGDYIVARLTGDVVTDPNNALKFHYMPSRGQYPSELLASLRIDERKLPRVIPVGSDIGPVLPPVAAKLGLPETCRVIMATYDVSQVATCTIRFNASMSSLTLKMDYGSQEAPTTWAVVSSSGCGSFSMPTDPTPTTEWRTTPFSRSRAREV
jgi:sugar (pentulose or hexulose) kinase